MPSVEMEGHVEYLL